VTDPRVPPEAVAPPARKSRLGWGCLILFLILILVIVCLGLAIYWIYHEAWELTEEEPWTLPAVEAPPEGAGNLERRAEAFREAPPPATLEVTEAELNALILRDPELAKSVRARLGPGKVFFDVSYPMSRLPAPASTLLGDRWFNGTVECDLKLEDGRIAIDPVGAVTAKDQERVDDWRLQPLRESRFLDQVGGERLEQIAGKATSVDVREGRIVIKK
jgi:hypothetical protein